MWGFLHDAEGFDLRSLRDLDEDTDPMVFVFAHGFCPVASHFFMYVDSSPQKPGALLVPVEVATRKTMARWGWHRRVPLESINRQLMLPMSRESWVLKEVGRVEPSAIIKRGETRLLST